jgi:essential nuclear protein 1
MPKATTPTAQRQTARRHNPLEDDIVATGLLKTKSGKKRTYARAGSDDGENFVDSKASKTILRIGRELDEEERGNQSSAAQPTIDTFGYDSRFADDLDDENGQFDDDEAWGDDDEVVEEIEVDPTDLETYRRFMPDEEDDLLKHGWDRKPSGEEQGETTNLADLIMAKIAAHEAKGTADAELAAPEEDYELPPKVVEVYTK